MSNQAAVWQQAADNFDRHYSAIGEGQWDAATPCSEWNVRELVDHAVAAQARIAGALGAEVTDDADWPTVRDSYGALLADPAALDGDTDPEVFGGMPKHQLFGLSVGDLLLHSWDLARAIGADEQLPAEAVETVQLGLARMPEERMRGQMFGPEIEVSGDASPQARLLAFAGRQP